MDSNTHPQSIKFKVNDSDRRETEFNFVKILGEGSFGIVAKYSNLIQNLHVAVKISKLTASGS